MAKRAFGGYSPDHNDVRLCQQGLTGPTGVTQQATAPKHSGGTYTPPSGSGYWTRIEGSNNFEASSGAPYDTNGIFPGYVVQHAFLIDATLGSAESGRIYRWDVQTQGGGGGTNFFLEWFYVSSSTFKLRITEGGSRTQVGTDGSTTFTIKKWVSWRVELDGTNITLWAGDEAVVSTLGSSEFTATEARVLFTRSCVPMCEDDLGSGEYIYHDTCALIDADSKFDRPDSDIIGPRANANGEGSDQGWGDVAAGGGECDAGSTTAVFTDILLRGEAPTNELVTSSYWCENASEGDLQGATTATVTLTKDWVGVIGVVGCQGSIAAKTVKTLINVSADGGTTWWDDGSETDDGFEMQDISWGADWRKNQGFFVRSEQDTDGPDWETLTQTQADALEFRIKGDSGNGANPHMAGAFLVLLQVSGDGVPTSVPIIVNQAVARAAYW